MMSNKLMIIVLEDR